MRHLAEGRASSLAPNLVYATILEFHAARKSRLANLAPPSGEDYGAYSTEGTRFTGDFCHGPDSDSDLEPTRNR